MHSDEIDYIEMLKNSMQKILGPVQADSDQIAQFMYQSQAASTKPKILRNAPTKTCKSSPKTHIAHSGVISPRSKRLFE